MIITHFDSDHAGGAEDLIKKTNISKVYVNSKADSSSIAKNIYELSKDLKVASDDGIVFEEPDLKIKTFVKKSDNENESSIMTLVTYKDFDMFYNSLHFMLDKTY